MSTDDKICNSNSVIHVRLCVCVCECVCVCVCVCVCDCPKVGLKSLVVSLTAL